MKWKWLESRRRQRAKQIMESGGPRSLKEFLFLFPEACPKCGSRDLTEESVTWECTPRNQPTKELGGAVTGAGFAFTTHCSNGHLVHEQEFGESRSNSDFVTIKEITTKTMRVYSPYLDAREADKLSSMTGADPLNPALSRRSPGSGDLTEY